MRVGLPRVDGQRGVPAMGNRVPSRAVPTVAFRGSTGRGFAANLTGTGNVTFPHRRMRDELAKPSHMGRLGKPSHTRRGNP